MYNFFLKLLKLTTKNELKIGASLTFDQNFLKTLTVLYAEDDAHARTTLSNIIVKLFKKVFIAEDGRQGLEYFKRHHETIDVIISDINMPHMSGMEMLEGIRKIKKGTPFIFTTAHQENDFLLGALKYGVYHYANKPVNIKEIIYNVQEACQTQYQYVIAMHNHKEAQSYLNVINQVAIVSKTDLLGDITYVNEMFCNISGYEEGELLGKSHSIIKHQDSSTEMYKEMWEKIRTGQKWSGRLKNKAKDGDAYFVNANIFPIYDEFDSEVVGYMSIQFLTTSEENEKREYKAHIRQITLEQKKNETELKKQIAILEKKLNHEEYIDILEENSSKATSQNKKLLKQMDYYEEKIRNFEKEKVEIQKAAKEHFFNIMEENKTLKSQNITMRKKLTELEINFEKQTHEVYRLNEQINQQSKVVFDLKDVIAHRESQLAKYQSLNN
jgi:PAS domain S-box-containing protein